MKPRREFKYRTGILHYDPMSFHSNKLNDTERTPCKLSYDPYHTAKFVGCCSKLEDRSSYQPYSDWDADTAYRKKEKEIQTYTPLPVSVLKEKIQESETEIYQPAHSPSILWILSWKKRFIGWFEAIFNILGRK